MPEIKKHPIATHMRERAMFDEGHFETLLHAYRAMLNTNRHDAAKQMEKALCAFRRDEIEAFAYALEQHEAKRIADSPSESSDA